MRRFHYTLFTLLLLPVYCRGWIYFNSSFIINLEMQMCTNIKFSRHAIRHFADKLTLRHFITDF